MSQAFKIFRASSFLRQPIGTNIVMKSLSSSCGDKEVEDKEQTLKLEQFYICPYCHCVCGGMGCEPTMYDCRKYGHSLPGNNNKLHSFPTLPHMPADVFRCTVGERLGPQGQASKCCMYKNPEYFSFHHMTYYDMHLTLKDYRRPSPPTGRKP